MTAQELRIGNYFTDDSEIPLKLKIIDWDEDYEDCTLVYGVIEKGGYIWIEDANPILLTEKWLQDFGFKKIKTWDDHVIYRLSVVDIEVNEFGCFLDQSHIKYVHQLQNLYFALRTEELTLK